MRARLLLLAALCIGLACPAFIVGQGKVGESIPILCENQEYAFVSSPSGSSEKIQLDSDFQSSFVPRSAGPYTVQCGNETATLIVPPPEKEAALQGESAGQPDWLAFAAAAFALLAFSAACLLAARKLFGGRVLFEKSVEGKSARLVLRSDFELENVEISDPVFMGFAGAPLRFSIPLLSAGAEWSWEYEIGIADSERALPAELSANDGKRKILLLSRLFIGGKRAGAAWGEAAAAKKATRKLKKAD